MVTVELTQEESNLVNHILLESALYLHRTLDKLIEQVDSNGSYDGAFGPVIQKLDQELIGNTQETARFYGELADKFSFSELTTSPSSG